MIYPSARYGVKHKTTSILIISTLYKYFSEADYTRIRVQKNYSVSLWRIFWLYTSCEGLPPFIDAHKNALSLFLSLSLSLSFSLSLSLNCFHETFYILYEGNIINLVVNSIRTKRPVVRVCSYTQLNSLDKLISNHKPREILNYIFITNLIFWYFIFAMYDYFLRVQWKYSLCLYGGSIEFRHHEKVRLHLSVCSQQAWVL